MKRIFLLIILSSYFYSCIHAPLATMPAQKALDSILESAVRTQEVPGGVAMIMRGDSLVYKKAFGYLQIEEKIPMAENSIFRLASMTKGLTAVAVLQLAEAGKIDLDDAVFKYIPEFRSPTILLRVLPDSTFQTEPAQSEITVRQLLTHTSGIGYGFQDEEYNKLVIKNKVSEGFCEDNRTSLENTLKIAKLPLLSEPGSKNIYSMSYDVLGTLIEVVSGLRYDHYIQQHILDPLEMHDSHFILPESKRNRLAEVYQPDLTGNGIELSTYPDIHYPVLEERQYFSGGADLCGTASDYLKFMQMIRHKGKFNGKLVLGEEHIAMMLAKQTPFDDGDSDQGFSTWVVNEKGEKNGLMSQGTYGFGGFFDTYAWTDPQAELTAILLLQMYPTNVHGVHEKFQEETYHQLSNF